MATDPQKRTRRTRASSPPSWGEITRATKEAGIRFRDPQAERRYVEIMHHHITEAESLVDLHSTRQDESHLLHAAMEHYHAAESMLIGRRDLLHRICWIR